MTESITRGGSGPTMSRRQFMAAMSGSAIAAQIGLTRFAGAAAAPESAPALAAPSECRVAVAFFHPRTEKYWMGWPGAAYDIKGHRELYTNILAEAAKDMNVRLDIAPEPIADGKDLDAFQARVKESAPTGVILTCMNLNGGWGPIDKFLATRGAIPTIAFSPMGTSFTGHLQASRKATNAFVAATQDLGWLAYGLRMIRTIWAMRNSRICVLAGRAEDKVLDVIGTTLHVVPVGRFVEELKKVEVDDKVKGLAEEWTKGAKKIVEPNQQDLINAARNYFACRRIMEAEKCQGVSMRCLDLVGSRQIPCPPCMAFARLRDEGGVGGCEADTNAAITLLLVGYLFQRGGFMQDPAPNTVTNTLMAAHCTSALRLDGYDRPPEPYILRSHSESNIGVSPQVLWRIGQRVTLAAFSGPGTMLIGSGKIVGNIDTPPAGGCRTSIDVEMDGVADSRDVKGFHQTIFYGDLARPLRAYCQLAGINAVNM